MPILIESQKDKPLLQGDVLKDINLCISRIDNTPKVIKSYAIVLSRQCSIQNNTQIIVAKVKNYPLEAIKSLDSIDKIKDFLQQQRDGISAPDRFYLGNIPGENTNRYAVNLDSLHTITTPNQCFINENRIASLCEKFIRDLHLRIFYSIARSGFNDISWLCDGDLKLLISEINSIIHKKEGIIIEKKVELEKLKADNYNQYKDKINKLEKTILSFEKDLEELNQEYEPYFYEDKKREEI